MSWVAEILCVGVDNPRTQAVKLQLMFEDEPESRDLSSRSGTVAALFRITYGKDVKFRSLPPKLKEL